jgi:hypothetical protein
MSRPWQLLDFIVLYNGRLLRPYDLNIPYITDEIKKRANRYRTRITDHENKLIDDLSNPHPNARRLKKTWPEDLTN